MAITDAAVGLAAFSLAQDILVELRRAGLLSKDAVDSILARAIQENLSTRAATNQEAVLLLEELRSANDRSG